MKRLAILGSTGSIGRQTLDVARAFPDRFTVAGLAGGLNRDLLAEQMREFRPRMYSSVVPPATDTGAHMVTLEDMASSPDVDMVVVATAGKAGLAPTLAAIRAGKEVALANKEALVMAGEIVMREAREHGVEIRPVDSEHSALWQCFRGEPHNIHKLFLTASGGPFYRMSPEQLKAVTPEQALRHPTWKMGRKVTVDSATLMNKGLEVIEAHWLFDVPVESIGVLVHAQSIVHALIEFPDGSMKAQMAVPDMRLPIQYALSCPERLPNDRLPRLDLSLTRNLTFELPDLERFPCLAVALEAGRRGGTCPAVLCAADEVAVQIFLDGMAGFSDIIRIVKATLDQHSSISHPSLEEIMAADSWARAAANKVAREVSQCR